MSRRKRRNQQPQKHGVPPPKCKAMLLCDTVIIDALSGKCSVIGIFDRFGLATLPGRTSPVKLFVQLTNGHGKYIIRIEVHDLTGAAIIARGAGPEIEMPDPLFKANVILALDPLPITREGPYDVVIFVGNQEIERQQFQAQVHIPPSETEQGQ